MASVREAHAAALHCGSARWEIDTVYNIVGTSSKPKGPPEDPGKYGRYDDGTPRELSSAMRRTWACLDPKRIVEDILRLPETIKRIIEVKGGVLPDECLRGCSRRKEMRPRGANNPEVEAAVVKQRRLELRARAKEVMGKREEE